MANTLRYNSTIPNNIYYGGAAVQNVYYNNTKVWSASPVSGTLAVGNTVTFDGKSWIVVHNSNNQWYLALSTFIGKIEFGRTFLYRDSVLADKCISWMNENLSATALAYCNDVMVEDVTNKVFIPTYAQVNGGFSYYNSNTNRQYHHVDELTFSWWTSSNKGPNIYFVRDDGSISALAYPTSEYAFRPHICITI